jgi:hypothetical protein
MTWRETQCGTQHKYLTQLQTVFSCCIVPQLLYRHVHCTQQWSWHRPQKTPPFFDCSTRVCCGHYLAMAAAYSHCLATGLYDTIHPPPPKSFGTKLYKLWHIFREGQDTRVQRHDSNTRNCETSTYIWTISFSCSTYVMISEKRNQLLWDSST